MTDSTSVMSTLRGFRGLGFVRLGRGRDYVLTFATEFATLASTLFALRLAAGNWGTDGFGEYVLARRALGLLQLPILCGMGVAVTRYVARARAEHAPHREGRLFVAGLLVAVAMATVGALALTAGAGPVALALFGAARYAPLVRALSVALVGIALHTVAYGFFRGRVAMRQANLLQGLNMAIVPLVVLALPGLTVGRTLTLIGVIWCTTAAIAIGIVLLRLPGTVWHWNGLGEAAGTLVRYGMPRIPGEFALGALFALPTTIVAHYRDVATAGFVGLGISFVTMIGSLFAPLGQLILPVVSAAAVRRDRGRLRSDAWRLTGLCLCMAVVGVLAIELLAGLLVPRFFGAPFEAAVPVIRVMSLGAVPYVAYIVLRNVLDALHTIPLNAKNLMIALAAFAGAALLGGSAAAVPIAFSVSLGLLGVLSARDAERALARLAAP